MRVLLYSGLLYLAGVAVILVLQPSLMFNDEGVWKEFGIGRDPKTHTWLPFWLFAILWAILSYIIVLLCVGTLPKAFSESSDVMSASSSSSSSSSSPNNEPNLTYKNFVTTPTTTTTTKSSKAKKATNTPIPGYYILNREATDEAGIPKYIYLGEEPPGQDTATD